MSVPEISQARRELLEAFDRLTELDQDGYEVDRVVVAFAIRDDVTEHPGWITSGGTTLRDLLEAGGRIALRADRIC
jgi:hypothetical protein